MWYNKIIASLLRSPVHGLVSNNIMLLSIAGRKSGQIYTFPVNYLRDADTLLVVSQRDRTWWCNLRDKAPVMVRLRGLDRAGMGTVLEAQPDVERALVDYLRKAPQLARYFHIALASDGRPDPQDITREAQKRVMVQIELA